MDSKNSSDCQIGLGLRPRPIWQSSEFFSSNYFQIGQHVVLLHILIRILIRPQLEYASAVWNPHDNKSVNKLEQVQKNAARFVTGNYLWSTSSSGLVSSLGWCTLEQRHLLNMVLLFFKFHNNLVSSQIPPEFAANQRCNRRYGLTYRQVQTNLLCYSFSFFPRAIRLWNNLPRVAVNATSYDSFRNAVQKAIPNLKVPCHLKRF